MSLRPPGQGTVSETSFFEFLGIKTRSIIQSTDRHDSDNSASISMSSVEL